MSGPVKGQRFELAKDRTTIGRSDNNDIVIRDEAVSSQHCYISRRGGSFVLHDLNSTNGTSLNLQPVTTEAPLLSKQVIQVGASELLFEGDTAGDLTAAMKPVTEVVVENAPAVSVPKTFSSVSPFGARYRSRRGLWITLMLVFGVIALVAMVYFVIMLRKLA